ncbi:SAM-dependent methyltransferase [bacterium]|nr:MAG: SAM-dependent methyltransferase [bacterium]
MALIVGPPRGKRSERRTLRAMPDTTVEQAGRLILEKLLREDLLHATVKRGGGLNDRITLRPILIKNVRMTQVSVYDGKTTDVKNHPALELPAVLQRLLTTELRSASISTEGEEIQVQITKKGKPLISQKKRAAKAEPDLRHDRSVRRPLPEGELDPFLQKIGFMTADGKIRAERQRKFQQINEFLRVVEDTADLKTVGTQPLLIVDFGCGNAYLTFSLHHYLNAKLGVTTELVGVDRDPEAIERNLAKASALGSETIRFVRSGISDFQAPRPADIVTALHACDTATDDALAKALEYGAKLVFASPCCHHHLQAQLTANPPTGSFSPMMRDGILKERLGDLVTDTLRALLLRIAGYEVDVIQFAAPEHTAKNLLIRAKRTGASPTRELIDEYLALKGAFGVTPYLEGQLPEAIRSRLV